MNYYLNKLSLLIVCSIFLASCVKDSPNIWNYYVAVSSTEKIDSLNFIISSASQELSKYGNEISHYSLVNSHIGESDLNFNFSVRDTMLIRAEKKYGDYHVLGYEVELYQIEMWKDGASVFESTDFHLGPLSKLEFQVEGNQGRRIDILFELDTDASITIDDEGNYSFEPIFSARRLL